jgi:hypothetical protein
MIYMWFTGINYYKLAVEKDRDPIFTTISKNQASGPVWKYPNRSYKEPEICFTILTYFPLINTKTRLTYSQILWQESGWLQLDNWTL